MAFQPPTEIMSAKGSQKTDEFISQSCAHLPLHLTLAAAEQKRARHMLYLCNMLCPFVVFP